MTEPTTIAGFRDWLFSVPPEFAFLLVLPFLVATAGLLRVGLFRDKGVADKKQGDGIRSDDMPRHAAEKPIVYLNAPLAAESEDGEESGRLPVRKGTLKRGAAS